MALTRYATLAAAVGVFAAALAAPVGPAVAAPPTITVYSYVPGGATSANVWDINNSGDAALDAQRGGLSYPIRWNFGEYNPTILPATTDRPAAAAERINDADLVAGFIAKPDLSDKVIRHWRPDGSTQDCAIPTAAPLGVVDLNERGDTLVGAVSGPRQFTAVVCHPDGTSTPTGLTSAYGIGDDGRVAGTVAGGVDDGFNYRPAVVSRNGTLTALPVPAGQSGQAYDVGPLGSVVGALGSVTVGSTGAVFVPRVAVVWIAGRTIELGTLGGPTSTVASTGRAVSRTGDIIGTSVTASGQSHAFRWRRGRMIDLGTLGGTSSTPTAVNDRGQVVGYNTVAPAQRAFVWTGGQMIDLTPAAGTEFSTARDINNAGHAIGAAWNRGSIPVLPVRWTIS